MSKAAEILKAGAGHMEDRAQTYDNPEGERSMEKCVSMFNALTGHSLSAEQGWHFMTCLKMVRCQQGGYRADNYEDGAAYFALAGEQAEQDRRRNVPETDAGDDHLTPQIIRPQYVPRSLTDDLPALNDPCGQLVNPSKNGLTPAPLPDTEPRWKYRGGATNYKHQCCGMTWFSSVEIQECPACSERNVGVWNG